METNVLRFTARFTVVVLALVTAGAAIVAAASPASARPSFQMPFRCGETWTGNNWDGHSPPHSIDWNYYPTSAEVGKPVVASAAGTVADSYYSTSTGYGHTVVIDHGGEWKTRYAHLDSRAVSRGAKVSSGQRIGIVGNSSAKYDLAVHLHYEQISGGRVVNSVVQGVTWGDGRKATQKSSNACGGGGHATGTVRTNGTPLNVRSQPSTGASIVGTRANGASVTIYCQTNGSSVTGTYGTSRIWNRIGSGSYISDAYTYTGSDGRVAPDC